MIPIFIHPPEDLIAEFNLSRVQIEDFLGQVIGAITVNFYTEWVGHAERSLKTTRFQYISGLNYYQEGKLTGVVALTGTLPNMIEGGAKAFDMKPRMLQSPKAKIGKGGGKYITIPFRFAGASSLGESSVFAGKLPKAVQSMIKKKTFVKKKFGGMSSAPLRQSEIPSPHNLINTRPSDGIPESVAYLAYQHKTSIYAGASRVKDVQTGQTRVMSFRRISENSNPQAFIHSGITAYNLADRALQSAKIDVVAGNAIDDALSIMGF